MKRIRSGRDVLNFGWCYFANKLSGFVGRQVGSDYIGISFHDYEYMFMIVVMDYLS